MQPTLLSAKGILMFFCLFFCFLLSLLSLFFLSIILSFFLQWLCVTSSVLTSLLCWLHVCFPQAAVRGQKGEKGEPAVLEPVSY